MKKFYILFLSLPILFFTLLYLSIWWFIGSVVLIMVFIAYRFYAEGLQAAEARKEVLEKELEYLNAHLENTVLKEQKASRDAEQMRKVKQHLLSVISHEIRTPMNGVLGTSLLLADTPLTTEQQEYINTIRSCGESLLTTINNLLVNDILDFSKLQQEGNQLEYKDFELRDAIEEVLDLLAVKACGLDLVYDIDENIPVNIIGDSKRLRQVLMNLVENAVKFTHQGEVFIGIHYTLPTATGYPPELSFEVRDTGIGISRDQLKQLFKGIPGKEFKKEKGTDTSGLGLVICKKLVEMMGGNIEVKSQPGQGSSFTFTIPMTPSLKETRTHARYNDMNKLEGKHILIVDDNATSNTALVKQMKSWKMLPVSAASGNEALEILSKNKNFDLVITDMNMPELNGVELAKCISARYPAIPMILLNPTGDEKYKQDAGIFTSVIAKPVRQNMLRDNILAALLQQGNDKQNNVSPLSDDFARQYPLRILVAEDNLINQKIAIKILTKLGYQPALANHGKEVMEMVSHEHYDIVLMDIQMPEMNGLEATRMIRTCLEIQPVIIAMTANVMQGDRDECLQAGMDDYMSKPIELPELLNQLERWSLVLRERRKMSA